MIPVVDVQCHLLTGKHQVSPGMIFPLQTIKKRNKLIIRSQAQQKNWKQLPSAGKESSGPTDFSIGQPE